MVLRPTLRPRQIGPLAQFSFADEAIGGDDLARRGEHQPDRQIRDLIRQDARGVRDGDPPLADCLEIDGVEPDTEHGDDLEPRQFGDQRTRSAAIGLRGNGPNPFPDLRRRLSRRQGQIAEMMQGEMLLELGHGRIRKISERQHVGLHSISSSWGRSVAIAVSGRGGLKGVCFGWYYLGNLDAADFIPSADGHPTKRLVWVAGCKNLVNWVDSAVVEMFFWDQFKYFPKAPPVERVVRVASRINEFMPGAQDELGFDIFVRKRGPGGGITSIMQERLSADEIAA